MFRAGVARREGVSLPRALGRAALQYAAIEQPRDAEIEQQRAALRVHQDVRGLEVAMHHQPLVCESHGIAHREEQFQNRLRRQRMLATIAVNGQAIDILHHQIGPPLRRGAAIEQPRDMRVRQGRQDLPFLGEEFKRLGGGQAVQQLDGGALVEMPVVAFRKKYAAHTAVPQLLAQAPGSQCIAAAKLRPHRAGQCSIERRRKMRGIARIALDQRDDVVDQLLIGT